MKLSSAKYSPTVSVVSLTPELAFLTEICIEQNRKRDKVRVYVRPFFIIMVRGLEIWSLILSVKGTKFKPGMIILTYNP